MFQNWRTKLREAEEALRGGRLDEAGRLLGQSDLSSFRPARQLSEQVAAGMMQRAQQRAAIGDTSAGWQDLQTAAQLGSETPELVRLKQDLIERGLREARNYLAAGDTEAALNRLQTLQRRQIACEGVRRLKQVAEHVQKAESLARRGRFSEAEAELDTALALEPEIRILEDRRQACRVGQATARELVAQLHEHIEAHAWHDALLVAQRWLELAPECSVARQAQSQAWVKIGSELKLSHAAERPVPTVRSFRPKLALPAARPVPVDCHPMNAQSPSRMLLWVDGVGGYLVCMGSEIVIGPPVPGTQVDIPIQADLSRRHAVIRRSGESYVLEPSREVRIEGRTLGSPTTLVDGNLIGLGPSVQLRFRRPHPLSATVRLEMVSRHRTHPAVDAIILMDQTLILGAKGRNHIVCPDWPHDVVLFRKGQELMCRSGAAFRIDGVERAGEGPVTGRSQVTGDEFSFSFEPV